MTEIKVGNFAFVYNINKELYKKLYSAERQAHTDFRSCGHESREALEIFIGSVLHQHNLTSECGMQDLRTKIQSLRDLLPKLGKVSFKYEDGRDAAEDYWDFMRKFGNTCSHADRRPSDVALTYANVVKCLRGLFFALKRYYKGQVPKSLGEFDETRMPIEEYCVYDSYIPDDSVRSRCMREFLAYTTDENGEPGFYAVIRQYNKQESSETFMIRNQKCFTEASKTSYSSVPDGMTRMSELIPADSPNSSFYLISYIFNQKPYPLNDALLAKMGLEQRVRFCGRIVNCLDNLHAASIYHRMLNYDCVFACEIRGEWIPYIVKFDYAKIVSSAATVQVDASRAKGFIKKEEKLNKYIAPEWDTLAADPDSSKWAGADIYSLGILCSDILLGKIGVHVPAMEDLEELDLSDEMLDLLDIMRAEAPEERWNMEDIKAIFDDEQKRFRKR